jgi:hypothetical protein
MNSIDERIRAALSEDDRRFLDQLGSDESLFADISATFSGRRRWMSILGWIVGFLLFLVAAYCGWRFFTGPDAAGANRWGAGMMLATLSLGLIKLWFWMELQTHAVIREVKRVELQLAGLTAALRSRGS